ncbi:Cilia- and flagella-associated protein 251 [Geranomyces michiganensis]|nr:Cilia- and flagella-associated protein 251 [Geranomyces michiganensis]
MSDPAESNNKANSTSPAASAMTLAWTFGLNTEIMGGIHALTENTIFYASAHTGVIHDYKAGTQQSMLGHCNQIAALTTSYDKRFLVTADKGADPLLIVWDTACEDTDTPGKALPIRTIFDPHHGQGVVAVSFTRDGQYMITLGDDSPQTIAVWDWTVEEDSPIASAVVDGEKQTCVMVNPTDPYEMLSTSAHAVNFYTWSAESGIQQYVPSLNPKDFKHVPTNYTQSTFLPTTSSNTIGQALTGTTDGDIVVWSDRSLFNLSETLEKGRKAGVKVMKLHTGGINVISLVGDKYVVTGGEDGFVRVHDLQFRLIVWFERLKAGPVVSISTTLTHTLLPPPAAEKAIETPVAAPALEKDSNDLPDLVIGTRHSKVLRLNKPGDGIVGTVGNPAVKMLMEGSYGEMYGLAIHPKQPQFAIGGTSGWLHFYDYMNKRPVNSRRMEEPWEEAREGMKQRPAVPLIIQCVAFDPAGSCLAIGFTNGTIRIVNPTTLADLPQRTPASHRPGLPGYAAAKSSILRIVFDPRGRWMAVTDAQAGIGVFEVSATGEWGFVGRCRAHYLEIVGVLFLPPPPEGTVSRLISVSQDRHLVEYDLAASSITAGIAVKSKARIDQTYRPLSAAMHPSPPLRGLHDAPQHYLLTANTGSKFRIYNAETGMCRRTVVAPAYGGDIRFLEFIPEQTDPAAAAAPPPNPRFLAYATGSKVVGLLALPLDGNPHRSMGMYAHPGDIAALRATPDGTMLLTLGKQDGVVNLWKIDPSMIESPAYTGPAAGMMPWLDLLHNGADVAGRDAFVREMEDYFYYAQLRSQGEATTTARLITTTVSLEQVPLIMQAMGYYPSQAETDDMLNEVRYAGCFQGADAQLRHEVGFEELVKLYVNHRPLEDYTQKDIFEALGYAQRPEYGAADPLKPAIKDNTVDRDGLIALLQQYGETLSAADFTDAMQALLIDDPVYRGTFPERATKEEFVENVLGMVAQTVSYVPGEGVPAT